MRKWLRGHERGFTMVELLVAIPIIGLLGLSMAGVLVQLQRSDRITEGMMAIRQVQAAGDRISQDAVQAQQITFNDNLTDPYDMTDPSWSLSMSWEGQWTDNTGVYNFRSVAVTYTLAPVDDQYQLRRHEVSTTTIGTNTENADFTATAGQYLDASHMSCEWVAGENSSLSLKVVAVVGTRTEERTYSISPRSLG